MQLGGGEVGVEPVEGVGARPRRRARRRASGIASARPSRTRPAPAARATAARMRSSGSTATTSSPAASSGRVSLPVPAPRSSTRSPGPAPSSATIALDDRGRVLGPAALVHGGDVGEAGDERMEIRHRPAGLRRRAAGRPVRGRPAAPTRTNRPPEIGEGDRSAMHLTQELTRLLRTLDSNPSSPDPRGPRDGPARCGRSASAGPGSATFRAAAVPVITTYKGSTHMATEVGIKELLEAGVHFGHQTRRWNPKMRRFIHGERAGIYIIDLLQTQRLLARRRTSPPSSPAAAARSSSSARRSRRATPSRRSPRAPACRT